jgi:aryl-alcohol dehydrogenase-like predicted oxidoreductase
VNRRDFVVRSVYGLGATWLGSQSFVATVLSQTLKPKFSASDSVTLGKTGIKTSRLAMGTGTFGFGHTSRQSALGVTGLSDLLLNGYDHGLRFFDTADAYGSHPHVAASLRRVARDKVTVMTKTWARDPQTARDDLDRFRRELKTDYIDVVLMHCLTEPDWTTRFRGVMDVLSEAKQKGIIRTHGVSCHSIGALRAAAKSPWVEVDLVRMNPAGLHMDSDPETVAGVIREMRTAGKGIIGMKVLGQGELKNRKDEALQFALGLGLLDAFTIGAESRTEQEELMRRISAVGEKSAQNHARGWFATGRRPVEPS